MTGWFMNIPDEIHKRVCCFLIHRYLSEFLKSKITLDQISISLIEGSAKVNEVDMDVQRLNEALESTNVPLNVIEGYIGEVNASVPWQNLPQKSCEIEIRQLQLTLQPQQHNGHDINQADLVSSMISSMVGSLASSKELAQSLMKEEQQRNDIEDCGVEQFAEVIDAILSRFRLVFVDTTIRLENEPDRESGLCNALEVQIDWIEFIDEQLNACQTQDASMEAITAQPHSLSAVPDLNKLFHLEGIRLYTDVFSRPEKEQFEDEQLSSSQVVVTSMYIRREKERTKRKTSSIESVTAGSTADELLSCGGDANDNNSGMSNNMDDSNVSSILDNSSTLLSPGLGRVSPSSETRPVEQFSLPERLDSNPILIAQFADEKHTVHVRIRNSQLSTNGCAFANKEIKLFFGGLSVFLTPSQLYILNSLIGKLLFPSNLSETACGNHGKPMKSEDFDQVETQLQACTNLSRYNRGNDFQLGNWGGAMTFFDAQRKPSSDGIERSADMANISLNEHSLSYRSNMSSLNDSTNNNGNKNNINSNSIAVGLNNKQRNGEATTTTAILSDETHVRATLANLVFVVTHKDPLGYENIRLRTLNGKEQIWDVIRCVDKIANRFFDEASSIRLSSRLKLAGIREQCDRLYEDDHLRFLAAGITFDYVLKKSNNDENNLLMSCTAANTDFIEVLTAESASSDKMVHIELLHFPPATDEMLNDGNPHFRMVINNQSKERNNYAVRLELAPCTTELDISILDRLSPLLFTKPFFIYSLRSFGLNNMVNVNSSSIATMLNTAQSLDLKDNIFTNTIIGDSVVPSISTATNVVSFLMKCSEWRIILRIPMADLRDAVSVNPRAPYWLRRVHRERLELELIDSVVEMRDLVTTQLSVFGSISLSATSLLGRFMDGQKGSSLQCTEDEQLFLYAGSSSGSRTVHSKDTTKPSNVEVCISYDFHNTSLKGDAGMMSNGDDIMQRSGQWGSFFRTNSKTEGGPFSHKVTVHENEPVTMVGSREELYEFGRNCMRVSNVNIEITMPMMRVNLPNHHFYEVLYNRLVNDLALWEPSSQLFKKTSLQSAVVNINAPFSDGLFQMCRCPNIRRESENDLSDAEGESLAGARYGTTTTSRSHADGSGSTSGLYSSVIKESQNHRICVQLNCVDGKVLIGATMTENKTACCQSQIGSELSIVQMFVVNGYHGNNDLTYFYFTAKHISVFHRNLLKGVAPYERNVREKNFARKSQEDIRVAPIEGGTRTEAARDGDKGLLCELIDDDNLAIAIRIDFHSDENIKNLLLATGLRNSQIHFMPFRDPGQFWLNQLVEFFSVIEYAIPGYELPETTTELHLHIVSTLLAYDHCCVKPDSPIKLRLVLGSCNVNTRIVQNAEVYKFECLFEETKLFLNAHKDETSATRNIVKFKGMPNESKKLRNSYNNRYVQMLSMGLFQIEVRAAAQAAEMMAHEQLKCPLIEVKCKNDLIKVWTCADSLITLMNIIAELNESDIMKKSSSSATSSSGGTATTILNKNFEQSGTLHDANETYYSTVTNQSWASSRNQMEERRTGAVDTILVSSSVDKQLSRLQEMVQSAITSSPMRRSNSITSARGKGNEGIEFGGDAVVEETESLDSYKKSLISDALNDLDDLTSPTSFDTDRQRSISSGTDEGFCVVDEIPGSGITNVGGEPRIRSFSDDIIVIENYLKIPNEQYNDDILRLPDDFATPLIRYTIRDFSLLLHLYGGNDFGDWKTAPKTYSCEEFRCGKGPGQRVEAEALGGANRDHSVHVEVLLSKISFVYQLFGIDASILSMNLLTVHEIEMRDRLALSQINKMLYQYASGQLPRRTCAPMFALRLVETHQNEGKLKLSVLPIRLNCDQDTLEFLIDFTNDVSANLIALQAGGVGETSQISDKVVMEVSPNILGARETSQNKQFGAKNDSKTRIDSDVGHEQRDKICPSVPLTPSSAPNINQFARHSKSKHDTIQEYSTVGNNIPPSFTDLTSTSPQSFESTSNLVPSELSDLSQLLDPPLDLAPSLEKKLDANVSNSQRFLTATDSGGNGSGNDDSSNDMLMKNLFDENGLNLFGDDSSEMFNSKIISSPLERVPRAADDLREDDDDGKHQLASRFTYRPLHSVDRSGGGTDKIEVRESRVGQRDVGSNIGYRSRMEGSDGWDHSEGDSGGLMGTPPLTSSLTPSASFTLSASPSMPSSQSTSSSGCSSPAQQHKHHQQMQQLPSRSPLTRQPNHDANTTDITSTAVAVTAQSCQAYVRNSSQTNRFADSDHIRNEKQHQKVDNNADELQSHGHGNISSVDDLSIINLNNDVMKTDDSGYRNNVNDYTIENLHNTPQHDSDDGEPKGEHDEVETSRDDEASTMVNSVATQLLSSYGTAIRHETFFKEFSFSPAVTIILDYQGKRVKTEQGTLIGLLIGLSNLQCTKLELKELHNRNGMLGIGRCVQFAINEWIQDIQSTQLGDVIGSYGPITSLVQIGKGIRDLFIMPVDEYRKNDGHIVKGLQKGAESFGISTAAAAVDIAQRVVGLVQGVAELAFDIVTPDYPAYANRRRLANAPSRRPPNDLREGFHMAYETVREGVTDTAQVLQLAAQEDRAEGHWPLRGLLRQATPSILRPIVVASKATIHLLGGIKSQLKPDSHRDELDKWRQASNSAATATTSTLAVTKYSRF